METRTIAIAALVIAGAAGVAVVAQQPAPDPPKSIGDARKRLEKPPGATAAPSPEQQVAVLSLVRQPDGTARVERVQVVNAVPPKVFARSRGDWEVHLQGRVPTVFRIANPFTDIEIENPPNSPSPYSQVITTGPERTEVIVPLSREGRALGVTQIDIVDTASGRAVVRASLQGATAPPTIPPAGAPPATAAPR